MKEHSRDRNRHAEILDNNNNNNNSKNNNIDSNAFLIKIETVINSTRMLCW